MLDQQTHRAYQPSVKVTVGARLLAKLLIRSHDVV